MVVTVATDIAVNGCAMDCEQNVEEEVGISQAIKEGSTLFNLGHAPREVIEKFQIFCFNYNSLSDAISALLKRDQLLVKKYRFLRPSVSYQMLVKPTINDGPVKMKKAMLALRQYARDGKYRLVANAIEELLNSPDSENMCQVSDTTACMVLKPVEQEALSKIADVLVQRLLKIPSQAQKERQQKCEIDNPTFPNIPLTYSRCATELQAAIHSNYAPNNNEPNKVCKTIEKESHKLVSNCVVDKPTAASKDSEADQTMEVVDAELNIPLERFAFNYKVPDSKLSQLHASAYNKTQNSVKGLYMLNLLGLIPTDIASISEELGPYQSLISDDNKFDEPIHAELK